MKHAVLFTASAALALAATLGACSESETPAPEASASESAAAPDDAGSTAVALPSGAVALAAGAAPTKEFLVGTWGEAPGCKMPINFQADGTIKDGPFDTWEVKDGKLTMGGLISMTLTVVDDKTMSSVNDGGGKTTLERC